MPEGDTIWRTARSLHAALAGRILVRFEARRLTFRPFPPGTVVTGAEARGKHCLVHFDDGRTLHTHMKMSGSWHLYRPGERWRRSAGAAFVVMEVAGHDEREGWVAVCFSAPVVELVQEGGDDGTGHLGPDLCTPAPDLDEAVRRFGALSAADRHVGDALLDQRIACGVGNVYRCEVLFAERLHPRTPVADVDEDVRRRLVTTAAKMLRHNLLHTDRITTADGGLAVYGRGGRPCPRCGAAVEEAFLGEQARITYWCPRCQLPPA